MQCIAQSATHQLMFVRDGLQPEHGIRKKIKRQKVKRQNSKGRKSNGRKIKRQKKQQAENQNAEIIIVIILYFESISNTLKMELVA